VGNKGVRAGIYTKGLMMRELTSGEEVGGEDQVRGMS